MRFIIILTQGSRVKKIESNLLKIKPNILTANAFTNISYLFSNSQSQKMEKYFGTLVVEEQNLSQ
jgi:hypothetical protein